MKKNEEIQENSESNFNELKADMSRPAMNQEEFDVNFGCEAPKHAHSKRILLEKLFRPYYRPFLSFQAFLQTVISFIPIIDWLPKYSFKSDLISDAIGGLTVGVMHVPQGIAYAALAQVPPVVGLYISFFPSLLYMLFGTSKHNSIGSFAVVSLMAGIATDNTVRLYNSDHNAIYNYTTAICDNCGPAVTNIQVACMLTVTIGFMHIIMGLMRMEFISAYFSDQVVAGFTTGSAVHVFASQISVILGIRNLPKRTGFGQLIHSLIDIVKNITSCNFYTLGISVAGIVFLHVGKEYITPYLKNKLKMPLPIPFELILVIISTALSGVFNLKDRFHLKVVDEIPIGMPYPRVPFFGVMSYVVVDALGIAAVVIAIHISLAKMLAKKYNYKVDIGQEFYAIGFTSVISGFFPMYVPCTALGRTLVNTEVGSRNQLSALFSSALLLAVILYFGKFLEPLPRCILAAIVVIALKGMFKQFRDLKRLWRLSTIDVSIWLISFIATVGYDVKEGLLISLAFALLTTVFRTQWSDSHILANLTDTNDYRDIERYKEVSIYKGILVLRFDSPLLFASVDRFKQAVTRALTEWNNSDEAVLLGNPYTSRNLNSVKITITNSPKKVSPKLCESNLSKHFIIDCSGIAFVDCMGVAALKEVYDDMCEKKVLIYFASAKASVRELFESSGFYKFVPKENFYPTIHDAVIIARRRQREPMLESNSNLAEDYNDINDDITFPIK